WSTLDEVDSHRVTGAWAFAMGGAGVAGAAGATDVAGLPWLGVAAKALAFVGLALAAGAVATRAYVLPGARPATVERAGAALLLAGAALLLVSQARAAGMGMGAYLADTTFGRGLAVRLALAAALLAWVVPAARPARWARAVEGALVAASVVGFASASHAAGKLGAWGVALDAVHLAAIAAWTGGLACLALVLRDDAPGAEEAGRRFSALATACVLAMGATGVALFVGILGPDPAAWLRMATSPYGVLLAAMVVLGLVMAGLGALNRVVHLARLLRTSALAWRRAFRRNVWREASVGAAVLLVAAALTNLSPVLVGAHVAAPTTAEGVFAACRDQPEPAPCYVDVLMALQAERGPGVAFDVLADMTEADPAFGVESAHAIAHDLGRDALQNFGSVQATLARCSERVFQGCIHGALQAYFESLPVVDAASVATVCDLEGPDVSPNAVRNCIHGVGHGILLRTEFNLNATLVLCDALTREADRRDCHQGVFMENLDSYIANRTGVSRESASGHGDHHGGAHGVADPANHAYPCDAVPEAYWKACWTYQPALLLHFNGNNLAGAARECSTLAPNVNMSHACLAGLGGMLAFGAGSDPARGAARCSVSLTREGEGACLRGFMGTLVAAGADPKPGLATCAQVADPVKDACYEGLGLGAVKLLGEALVAGVLHGVGD
ncbi:MAG TPA: CopD family protein, partial [Candidatus Thermoplasmatota archaeon]|nr:CopD family protein [Candidatus Thermoplasmatota archaeon]